jgi:hypothetical protein
MGEERARLGLHCLSNRARYSCGVPDENKRETADALMRSAELEFERERARWQRDHEKHRFIRLLSFSFFSFVILGALVALFLALSRANEMRNDRAASRLPSPIPHLNPLPEGEGADERFADGHADAKAAGQTGTVRLHLGNRFTEPYNLLAKYYCCRLH